MDYFRLSQCRKVYNTYMRTCTCTTTCTYRIAGKFGGLAVYLNNRQIKIRQNFLLAYIRVAIPYRTAKLNSTNTFAMAIWDPTAKFNSRQYFQLYGILTHAYCIIHMHIAHIHVRNSCKTLIGVQEMHGRMHPN